MDLILALRARPAYSEVIRDIRVAGLSKGCIVLEDFLLFLGLLGLVCSVGMRIAARREAARRDRNDDPRP